MGARRKRPREDEFEFYWLHTLSWEARYVNASPSFDSGESLEISLGVELREPVKGVERGSVDVGTSHKLLGGRLEYDRDKVLHGWVWFGPLGSQGLLTLLASGQLPVLGLMGKPFRYRKALIRGWQCYWPRHTGLVYLSRERGLRPFCVCA